MAIELLGNWEQAKDWGWREFVTLTSLFDLDAGFLVNDCVVFAAEVLVLRETSDAKQVRPPSDSQTVRHMEQSCGVAGDRLGMYDLMVAKSRSLLPIQSMLLVPRVCSYHSNGQSQIQSCSADQCVSGNRAAAAAAGRPVPCQHERDRGCERFGHAGWRHRLHMAHRQFCGLQRHHGDAQDLQQVGCAHLSESRHVFEQLACCTMRDHVSGVWQCSTSARSQNGIILCFPD